jgi:hypothetical protein
VWLAPKGTSLEDIEDDGTNFHFVSWSGRLAVTGVSVMNTSDYNSTTRLMNPRDINVEERLTGTLQGHHNSDADRDILLLYPVSSYPAARLYITQGNVAVVGPPAIDANRRCYFDLTEAQLMTRDFQGGEPNTVRALSTEFQSNGIFTYNNVEAA